MRVNRGIFYPVVTLTLAPSSQETNQLGRGRTYGSVVRATLEVCPVEANILQASHTHLSQASMVFISNIAGVIIKEFIRVIPSHRPGKNRMTSQFDILRRQIISTKDQQVIYIPPDHRSHRTWNSTSRTRYVRIGACDLLLSAVLRNSHRNLHCCCAAAVWLLRCYQRPKAHHH